MVLAAPQQEHGDCEVRPLRLQPSVAALRRRRLPRIRAIPAHRRNQTVHRGGKGEGVLHQLHQLRVLAQQQDGAAPQGHPPPAVQQLRRERSGAVHQDALLRHGAHHLERRVARGAALRQYVLSQARPLRRGHRHERRVRSDELHEGLLRRRRLLQLALPLPAQPLRPRDPRTDAPSGISTSSLVPQA